TAVALSGDGKTLAWGAGEGEMGVWQPATGGDLGRFQGQRGTISALAFVPNGRMLASADGKTIRLWDVATLKCRRELAGHTNQVLALDCSPDGRTLVSGSDDGTALVWDLYAPPQE